MTQKYTHHYTHYMLYAIKTAYKVYIVVTELNLDSANAAIKFEESTTVWEKFYTVDLLT